jgi:hypothetical protein
MKTTLQYNDEEEHEAKCALHAKNLYASLWTASQALHSLLKYRDDLNWTEAQDAAIRDVMMDMSEGLDFLE